MLAKRITCEVVEVRWATPSVFIVHFEVARPFSFAPGQFMSVIIPQLNRRAKPVKRLYSLANGPEEAKRNGFYELCIRYQPAGKGSEFLSSLTAGDRFEAYAPYGDFYYRPTAPGRSVCLISTSTGIAPMRSMVLSRLFSEQRPEKTLVVAGFRTEDEILYRADFETSGVEAVFAVSQASEPTFNGFKGRVTDYLRTLPTSWPWHQTDFYLCGNGEMLTEVDAILRGGHNVPANAIQKEAFTVGHTPAKGKVLPFRSNATASASSGLRKALKFRW